MSGDVIPLRPRLGSKPITPEAQDRMLSARIDQHWRQVREHGVPPLIPELTPLSDLLLIWSDDLRRAHYQSVLNGGPAAEGLEVKTRPEDARAENSEN